MAIWYNNKLKPMLVISAYWDITTPAIPLTLTKAYLYDIGLLILCTF